MPTTPDLRKKCVFRAVVREYLASAEPVGSETIVIKYGFGVSPATIRNDMAELEGMGLLEQPHTSAGRVPTEKGYRFYVDELTEPSAVAEETVTRLDAAFDIFARDVDAALRDLAKAIAATTDETVFVSANGKIWCVTGVANLVRKPEFRGTDELFSASRSLDDLDEFMAAVDRRARRDIDVLIGGEHPLSHALASVVARFDAPGVDEGMLGILGPTRMNYDANLALAKYIHELFSRE